MLLVHATPDANLCLTKAVDTHRNLVLIACCTLATPGRDEKFGCQSRQARQQDPTGMSSREACKGPLCSFGSRKAAAKQPSALGARKLAPSKGPPAACQAVVKQLDGKVDGLAGRLEEALARDPARFRWVVFIL